VLSAQQLAAATNGVGASVAMFARHSMCFVCDERFHYDDAEPCGQNRPAELERRLALFSIRDVIEMGSNNKPKETLK
jgi:hypothetical protein